MSYIPISDVSGYDGVSERGGRRSQKDTGLDFQWMSQRQNKIE